MTKIKVLEEEISFYSQNNEDFISLTDIAKHKSSRTDYLISNWLRNRETIEFLATWEKINNEVFNSIEFDGIKKRAGLNSFLLSVKQWVERTNAIGLKSTAGRYGGTFAHKDIAFEFASWISVEFKLYLIKEFQRLKENESKRLNTEWNVKRQLVKINYKIHTEAIKENLIPKELSKKQTNKIYATEADVLNMALFGKTAKQWRKEKYKKNENMRDYANVTQLVCLSNLENFNALFIEEKISQTERLKKLNKIAISQMKLLTQDSSVKKLESAS